jgi:mycothiol synthase
VPTTSPELTWETTATPALVAEVEALAAAAAAADGTAPLSEQVLRQLRHPRHSTAEHLLARAGGMSTEEPPRGRGISSGTRAISTEEPPPGGVGSSDMREGPTGEPPLGSPAGRSGALVGYAQLDPTATAPDGTPDPVAELVVHPAHRRYGIGSALLAAVLDRSPAVRVWAHGALPAAGALAARAGLTAQRELWRMRRDLDIPLPDLQMPDGVRIRSFAVGADEAELLRVNNAAFAWHPEQGGWTLDDVAEREAEPWFDPDGVLLAVDVTAPQHVLGIHWTKVHAAGTGEADATAPVGEVYVLGVDPAAQGRRLGPALTLAGLAHLRDLGLGAVVLYVEADNAAAVRLYRDLGFERFSADVSYRC